MTPAAFPFITVPDLTHLASKDFFSKVNEVYQQVFRDTTAELWMSSARIIQEHTVRAMLESSQACMQALAQNAASIQQDSWARLAAANQKAGAIVAHELTDTVTAALTAK